MTFMLNQNQIKQLKDIVDKLLGREDAPLNALARFTPPFDISRPNIHDSKKVFLQEFTLVKTVVDNLRSVIDQILVLHSDEIPEYGELCRRLAYAIEVGASQKYRDKPLNEPSDLALKNIADTGFFTNSLRIVIDMNLVYNQRLIDLQDQEKEFWNVANRAPNYYARTIALRLARLYANEKNQRPTFGISREGNYPSTDFGRALEDVFALLGIKASVRNAAQWAIEQLTDEDISSPRFAMGGFLGLLPRTRADPM
ncbi:hypothetical protein PSQ90_10465 [Devosia rhodophyticola]|uniref:Uncharacterized protein n=1 Tax=Devosia rhodophyticola TaxID=3026423 RepID=A0ABY7YUF4_9HYPH|nr:hypothetical protein [Devosia rhodophyticola]WDR04738.1 hypothetical protein PSQ90_10465 [Devosia rhodophyticola]